MATKQDQRPQGIGASLTLVPPGLIIVLAVMLILTEGRGNLGVVIWASTIAVVAALAILLHLALANHRPATTSKESQR